MILRPVSSGFPSSGTGAAAVAGQRQRSRPAGPLPSARCPPSSTAFAVVVLCAGRTRAYSPAMGIRLRCWHLAQEHKLAAWACLSAVLIMTETMIANVRHLPGSRDPVVYAIAGVVYLALVVLYRFPAVTVLLS